jgi:hypothetical protein
MPFALVSVYSVIACPSVLPKGFSVIPILFSFLVEESGVEVELFDELLQLITAKAREAANSD